MSQEPKHLWGKLSWYFADPWNIADMLSLFSFGAAAGLRYISWYQLDRNPKLSRDTMTAARIILATDVIIFIIRILQIFSVNKNLGPKLVMIRKMVRLNPIHTECFVVYDMLLCLAFL